MTIEKPEKKMKAKKIVTVIALLIVVLAALSFGFGHSRQKELIPIEGAAYLSSSPHVNVTLNLSISSLSYLDQKPQAFWTGLNDSFPGETIFNNSDFVINTSSYQIFQNNKSSSAQASPSYAVFTMGSLLGTNITYLYSDSRVALNGSTTFYYVLSENNFAAFPTSAGNSSTIFFTATYSGGNYSVTYNYFNSSGYHTGTFTNKLAPLHFYQFFVLVQNESTVLSINQGGNTIDTVTLGAVNLSNMLTSKATGSNPLYSEYMTAAGANTTNTSMILNFGYLVDHNSYNINKGVSSSYLQTQGPQNAIISGTLNSLEPFDPGNANATFIGNSNKTTDFGHNNVNITDFSNVTRASSNVSIAASGLNKSLIVNNVSKNNTINASQAFTTLAATNEANNTVRASLELYSWNATYVSEAINTFMKDYTSGLIAKKGYNVGPNEITVANYVITKMGFDQKFGNNTANAIRAEVDNAFAADLKSVNLTLVNTTTNAIVAGAFAGDFLYQGMAIHPLIQSNEVIDPVSGQAFQSLQAAGFASGTYISQGAVIVPSLVLVGPNTFTTDGFSLGSLNPLTYGQTALTAAGSAVNTFFSQAQSTATNLVNKGTATTQNLIIKPISTTPTDAYSKLSSAVSSTVSQAIPFLGGTVNKISTSFGSGLNTVTGDLGSDTSATAGALLTGANDVKTTAFNVGDFVKTTAGNDVSTSDAVLSSLYKSGTSHVSGLLNDGIRAVDTVGGVASNAWTKVSGSIISDAGAIEHGATSAFNWISSIGATIGHILVYVGVGVLVVVVSIIIILLLKNRGEDEDTDRPKVGNEGPSL